MGLFDKVRGQFIDIVEFLDDSRDTLVWRFPRQGNEIKNNAQLIVREGQVAVFESEGQIADVFTPGTYTLETKNLPILSTIKGWKYGFNSPFKAEVYFVGMRQYTDMKWGTQNPVTLRDAEFGMVRLRAFGTYSLQVVDASKLLRELVGTDPQFRTDEVSEFLRQNIVSQVGTALGNSNLPMLDLAANQQTIAATLAGTLTTNLADFGISIPRFVIENISLPPEVEEALDKRTSMGVLGNLDQYTKFQAAEAIGDAANNPGGAGEGMGMGMGMALGQQMANALNPQQAAASAPAAQGGPPPAPGRGRGVLHGRGRTAGRSGHRRRDAGQDRRRRAHADHAGVARRACPSGAPRPSCPSCADCSPPRRRRCRRRPDGRTMSDEHAPAPVGPSPLSSTCPNCGAQTAYAPGTTALRCGSCGTDAGDRGSRRPDPGALLRRVAGSPRRRRGRRPRWPGRAVQELRCDHRDQGPGRRLPVLRRGAGGARPPGGARRPGGRRAVPRRHPRCEGRVRRVGRLALVRPGRAEEGRLHRGSARHLRARTGPSTPRPRPSTTASAATTTT